MENCYELTQHHDYCKVRRTSARQAESARKPGFHGQCSCCRDDQVLNFKPKHQHSATTARRPQKRKRTSVTPLPEPFIEHPEIQDQVPARQPSTPAADFASLLSLVPSSESTIPPDELPAVSDVTPSPQPSSAPLLHDSPLTIHNRSVEEYQRIYHEVVDDMLRYKNGRLRPYSLALGRRIKQKLWETLDRPKMVTSASEDGLLHIDESYGVGVYPPLHDVDTWGEPTPEYPARKRAKTQK